MIFRQQGFEKLAEALSWCRDLAIPEVTVYAFSIENFKRSPSEVEGLMVLMQEKFEQLLRETEALHKYGIRIKVLGDISLLTQRIQELVAKITLATKNNSKYCLNIALAYTSRQEMCAAIETVSKGVASGHIRTEDINELLLEKCLYTAGSQDPDLLIRTSGETRLSDLLMWQTGLSYLYFMKALWPQISIWHFLAAIFHYQRHHHFLVELRKLQQASVEGRIADNNRIVWLRQKMESKCDESTLEDFVGKRNERTDNFLGLVNSTREKTLKLLAKIGKD